MIDSHCHFDLPAFDGQRAQLLANCEAIGVYKLLVPGLSAKQFLTLLSLQDTFSQLDIAMGCHPYFLKEFNSHDLRTQMSAFADLASEYSKRIVAIGECGLDLSLATPIEYQEKVLRYQLEIAKSLKKPLILHHRKSHNAIIRILKQERFENGGIIHAFSGSEQTANTYIDLGFALGVGGTITYERAIKTRSTIAKTNLKHIVLETDAPDMPLYGYQGMPNSPEKLPLIAKVLAELQECTLEVVKIQTTLNYEKIFSH